jgi:hypothetical protein
MSTKRTIVTPKPPESRLTPPAEQKRRNFFFESIPLQADGIHLDFGGKTIRKQWAKEWIAEEVPDG